MHWSCEASRRTLRGRLSSWPFLQKPHAAAFAGSAVSNRAVKFWARRPGVALISINFLKVLNRRGLLRSHREHRRADCLARLQVAMRLRGFLQRVGLIDLDLDRA